MIGAQLETEREFLESLRAWVLDANQDAVFTHSFAYRETLEALSNAGVDVTARFIEVAQFLETAKLDCLIVGLDEVKEPFVITDTDVFVGTHVGGNQYGVLTPVEFTNYHTASVGDRLLAHDPDHVLFERSDGEIAANNLDKFFAAAQNGV